jgi:hypothetical protein
MFCKTTKSKKLLSVTFCFKIEDGKKYTALEKKADVQCKYIFLNMASLKCTYSLINIPQFGDATFNTHLIEPC